MSALTHEVGELKEMVMLSLLEKESASDRLRAVSLTSEMNQVSDNVSKALFMTLNSDPNVNVRLAALEALIPFVSQGGVREGKDLYAPLLCKNHRWFNLIWLN